MSNKQVAIIGRPNVGKSTLFNRLVGGKVAIEEKTPGVTRDRLYGRCLWNGQQFILVDTGGLELSTDEEIKEAIVKQGDKAIRDADLLLFLVDAKDGLTSLDEEIAHYVRQAQKPLILVVNKVDNPLKNEIIYDFCSLNLGDPFPISSAQGFNIGDLLDEIVRILPDSQAREEEEAIPIAIIGRPNVGKSSLLNFILAEDRAIVNPMPGTTRDAIDTPFRWSNRSFMLIDTAGIRKKSKVTENIEYYSVQRALKSIERSRIVLLLVDVNEAVVEQEQRLWKLTEKAGKGCLLVVNKWDLVPKEDQEEAKKEFKRILEANFPSYLPVSFISAKTGLGVKKLFPKIISIISEQEKQVETPKLNRLITELTYQHPPPSYKGKQLKIYYATQIKKIPPTFIFFVNSPNLIHFSYERYLENYLRKEFGFKGTPLRIIYRPRKG